MRSKLKQASIGLTCMALVQAAAAMNIVVGEVSPLSGLNATEGRAYSAGMALYFNEVNRGGGVNGNQFTVVRMDDAGRPNETIAATRELLSANRPLVLTGYFGNRNVADLVASGILGREKIAIVGYHSWSVRPETPYLFSVNAGLHEQIEKIVEHLVTIGISRLGLLYEDGPAAGELLRDTEGVAKKFGAQIGVRASYQPGTAKVANAVSAFIKSAPQAIVLVASGAAAAAFIEEYRSAGGTAQIFAHSEADVEQMSKRLSEDQLRGVAIAQVTPSPYSSSSRVARELSALTTRSEKLDVPVSYAMMDGFIAARVIVEAVRRAGSQLSRERFVASMESLDNFDAGGFFVSFKSGKHVGSRFVELSIVTDTGKIRQ